MVLDDFFGGGDAGDETVFIHGGAGAAEADAKEDAGGSEITAGGTGVTVETLEADADRRLGVTRGGKPGVKSGDIKVEAGIGGLGDVAVKDGARAIYGWSGVIRG